MPSLLRYLSRRSLGVAAMFVGVSCFAVMGAFVAQTGYSGLGAACLMLGSAAITLSLLGFMEKGPLRVPISVVTTLAILNLTQTALYFAALQMAPVGPAAALHLAAPILILGWEVIRGRRQMDPGSAATVALLVAALALAALSSHGHVREGASGTPMLGLGLALLSAVFLAAMLTYAFRTADRVSLHGANAVRNWMSALILAPAVLMNPPTTSQAATLVLCGALLVGPGLALVLWAIIQISPQISSIIDLWEAVATPMFAAAAFSLAFTPLQALVLLPMFAAAFLEMRRLRTSAPLPETGDRHTLPALASTSGTALASTST